MTEKAFIDTNIIIYAHDKSATKKNQVASELLIHLWESGEHPIISVQVLQELFVNLSKHLKYAEVGTIIQIYTNWIVVENSLSVFENALLIHKTNKISFWDSCIVSAAKAGDAKIIYTEDLNNKQMIAGIRICNPFQK